jgi:hypothetical protein
VSRLELLRHLEMFENPNFGRSAVTDKQRGRISPADATAPSKSGRKQRHLQQVEEDELRGRSNHDRNREGQGGGRGRPRGVEFGGHERIEEERSNQQDSPKEENRGKSRSAGIHKTSERSNGELGGQKMPRGQSRGRVKRVHDSWSSRASSILAIAEEAEVSCSLKSREMFPLI